MDAFDALSSAPRRAALVMDFDGVLSPIVSDPAASALYPGNEQALTRLAGKLGLVALLSGRPLAFLQEKAPVPGVRHLGSYGAETSTGVHPAVERWLEPVTDATRRLRSEFGDREGLLVEQKAVSVAIHWRNAPDREQAGKDVAAVVADLVDATGLHREPGKLVEELRPPIDIDKGTALRQLLQENDVDVLVYAGDDRGDIPAFRFAVGAGHHAVAVDHGPETDPQVLALAGEILPGVEGFAAWLDRLAARVAPAAG